MIKTGIENKITFTKTNHEIEAEHAIGIGVAGGAAGIISQVVSSLVEPMEIKGGRMSLSSIQLPILR